MRSAAVAGVLAAIPAARADPQQNIRNWEVWSGADVAANVWLVYSGGTVAPFGDIHSPGLRLRATGGFGAYSYAQDLRRHGDKAETFDAKTWFTDALAGYLWRLDPLIVKTFVGFSAISHDIQPIDTESVVIGSDFGVKGVVELWLNVGASGWSSLDLSWSSAHDTWSARMRSGYRILPTLSVGLEAGINGDAQAECRTRLRDAGDCAVKSWRREYDTSLLDYARTGIFARYEWYGGELSVSGGGLGQMIDTSGHIEVEPYVTVNWITQF